MSEASLGQQNSPAGPVIWPPVLGIVWAAVPLVAMLALGASDWGVTILYLWAWSVIVPALCLGIGAVVVRFRYGSNQAEGRFRRGIWYWIGGLYAVAAIPILALML